MKRNENPAPAAAAPKEEPMRLPALPGSSSPAAAPAPSTVPDTLFDNVPSPAVVPLQTPTADLVRSVVIF